MAKVITYINEKGGIGKTSVCFNTAWELARRGRKILMIDMDGQQANLTYFCGVNKDAKLATMHNVLMQDEPITNCIVTVRENLGLIPANNMVANIPNQAKIPTMLKAVKEARELYDYIFIDVNPSPNWNHVLALAATDFCIIPMLPDVASLEGNKGIIESIEQMQAFGNNNLKVLGLLINKNNNTTNLSKTVANVANEVAKKMNTKVFRTKVRNGVAMSENVYLHIGVTEYKPKEKISQDIRDLADEIEEEVKKHG